MSLPRHNNAKKKLISMGPLPHHMVSMMRARQLICYAKGPLEREREGEREAERERGRGREREEGKTADYFLL